MMAFEYLKLNRNRKIIKRMSINLDDYIAVLSTGYNWKLMREKGRPLELYDMITFDDFNKLQRQNDEAVERRTFSYIYHGDGRKISDKVRDEKGKPLKEYTKPEDILGKAIKLNYIEDKELFKYAKGKGILFYADDRWREILKDRKTIEQEKEDQFFEERGNMIVGEDAPLWIKIAGIFLLPIYFFFWLKYKIKK